MNSHQILPLVSPTSSTGSSTYAGEDCTAVGSCSTGTQTPTSPTSSTGSSTTETTEVAPDPPTVQMCFVSGMDRNEIQDVLMNIQIVQCKPDEICIPAKKSQYKCLGYVFFYLTCVIINCCLYFFNLQFF